ncbi:MAG: 2-oxoacid:ferredoxin oxidoreductase subunit beta [Spirochaetales bacterium]|nr:2-oxoacid:ferredoxin oxidoreductase subunit beta [Spirochaetales bacterium]
MAQLTKKDFTSDQEVRWCPGCGDYAILSSVQKSMPELSIPREQIVVVSGIGCAARFPYYMNTYGFHTIHGRAPAIATGIKISRPELTVFVATGDGDALSIGGNHLVHALRRNIDINILLFNNEIYGLTKGQYSPTSRAGLITKSTPFGNIDAPLHPLSLAMGAEGSFLARTLDKDVAHMGRMVNRAVAHRGTALLEILQNCVIFNDGAFAAVTEKEERARNVLYLEHGEPLLFGKEKELGIRIRNFRAEVVRVADVGLDEIHVHDETCPDAGYAFLLSRMQHPEFPLPVGVLRAVARPAYEAQIEALHRNQRESRGSGNLQALLYSGDTWTID